MATMLRTKFSLVLLVLLNRAIDTKCDVRTQHFKTSFVPIIEAEHLLRGGNEDGIELMEDKNKEESILPPQYHIKNTLATEIERDTTKSETEEANDEYFKMDRQSTLDYDNMEKSNTPTDSTEELKEGTTETAMTAETLLPEALGLSLKGDDVEVVNNFDNKDDMIKLSDVDVGADNRAQSIDNANEETAATPLDITETTTTNEETMSDVYKQKDTADEIYSTDNIGNRSKDIDAILMTKQKKVETTTTSLKTLDEVYIAPKMASLDDELDNIGTRNPKTEHTDSKQSIDKRNFDVPKPRTPVKVSRSSTLKGWLEDSWLRAPAGLLVPLRPTALSQALAVWNDLIATEGLNITDIIVIGYDSNGVIWRSRHNLQNNKDADANKSISEALSKLLMKYQQTPHARDPTGDATMKALTQAAKMVPYDSALFLITDRGAADLQRLPLALRALVGKRLKVYTVWTDPQYPAKESLTALGDLKKISEHTEGDILPYSLQITEENVLSNLALEMRQFDITLPTRAARYNILSNDKFQALLVRRGGGNAGSHGIPVENGVTSLRVYIEGAVDHAILYPPNGPQIDLYNETSVKEFSPLSKTLSLNPREVILSFPGAVPEKVATALPTTNKPEETATPTVGLWHLSVRCDTCDYRLTVSAHGKISLDAMISENVMNKEMLHLRVRGPVGSVRETILVDEYGTEVGKLPFSYEPAAGETPNTTEDANIANLETDLPLPSVKGSKIYVKVVGRDVHGESFVRLAGPLHPQSEIRMSRSANIRFPESIDDLEILEAENQKLYDNRIQPYQFNDSVVLPNGRGTSQVINQRGSLLTAVQIGLSTRLYGTPGENLQLHFEVTNFRDQSVSFRFEAVGELRFLRGISPLSQVIAAGQTVNVIVNIGITSSAQPGARDLVTFTAYGLDQVSISAYVYVVNPNFVVTDVWSPELRHNFQGTCIGRLGDDCAQHTWSATIISRDAIGGLLRLTSSPVGLTYDTNFISGTREEVMATYRTTCCTPRVMVTAIDAYGNANSYVIDISHYFTEAAIAAIVLGVIFLIALIILIVFLIYWCVKRRKESRELPSYPTASRTTRRDIA